jgi:hypothetical protein
VWLVGTWQYQVERQRALDGGNTYLLLLSYAITDNPDGNYTLTLGGEKGSYSYDAATKQVKFTGFPSSLPVRYGEDTFLFLTSATGERSSTPASKLQTETLSRGSRLVYSCRDATTN